MQNNQVKKKSSNNKFINLFFGVLIVVGFSLIIYNNRDELNKYKETLLNINYLTLTFVFVITMTAVFFRSWRWFYLLLPLKKGLSFLNVFRVSINALAANFTMPGKLGVPVKAVLLKKSEDIEVGKSLPSILGEIFIEHSSELTIAFVSVLIGGHLSKLVYAVNQIIHSQSVVYNILVGISIVALITLMGFIFKKKVNSMNFIAKFIEAISVTRKRKDYLTYSYMITIFNLIVSYWVFWLVISSLGHPEVDLTFVIFAGTVTNFVGLISPFPGGVGVREITIYGLYDFYFGLGGIAFLAILIMRIITYLSLFISFILERTLSGYINSKRNKEVIVSS